MLDVYTTTERARLCQLADELVRYKIDILGLSEVRWKGNRKLKLSSEETFLYSRKEEEEATHESKVRFMTGKKPHMHLWIGSDRLLIRFETKFQRQL